MCGLMLAFVVAAALWRRRRRRGGVARIDFSMIEAMLWTMAEPLLATQLDGPPQPSGNGSERYAPHGVYRCAGDDAWISVAVATDEEWQALCAMVPGLMPMAESGLAPAQGAARSDRRSARGLAAASAMPRPAAAELRHAGVPAAALANARDLVAGAHLRERGFWDAHDRGVLPGLPWRASFGRRLLAAPGLGADTDAVLAGVLGLAPGEIAALRRSGALG